MIDNLWTYYEPLCSDIWNPNELYHHGIKGQKWGVRRFQNPDGSLTEAGRNRYSSYTKKVKNRLSNSETANLDKWGKYREHNLLYITGLSGSGKSTVATYMADDGKTDYINLDSYFGQMSPDKKVQWQSKAFNKYLDKRVPDWKKMSNGEHLNYDIVDKFAKALKDYSRIEFDEGKKVIAEGIQIFDETLFESRSSYSGEPMIILKTNKKESAELSSKRDGMKYVDSMLNKYDFAEKSISELSAFLGTKTGEQWVKDYINNLGLEDD